MGHLPSPAPEILSLLAFWRDAGVDYALEALPQNRLAGAERPREPAPSPPPLRAAAPSPAAVPAGASLSAAAAEAQRLAAQATGLETLAAAIAQFQGCPLSRLGASRSVVSRGRADAPLLVIGEAPGAEEDKAGLPFVGRAGRLLDHMLAAAGLEEACLITNTVFWRPPGNRNPTADEIAVCRPFLERLAELADPKLVLLVGGVAAGAVLGGEEGILRRRGRWEESELGGERRPAMATFHPAFLLRQPAQKKAAWFDLLEVKHRLRLSR